MIGAAFSSLGVSTPLAEELAVNACWNSVSAVGGSQVPAGCARSFHVPFLKYLFMTSKYPCANSVALLSVGEPRMTMSFGDLTFHALTQLTMPPPISLPTLT